MPPVTARDPPHTGPRPGEPDDAPEKGDALPPMTVIHAAVGDPEAWRTVLGTYARRVYAFVRSRGLDAHASEEVTQSVFVTLSQQLAAGKYREAGRFEAWLFRVASNRARDELRRRRRQARPVDPVAFDRDAEAEPARAQEDELAALRGAIARLGEADRAIIVLRHHAQLSFKQIAEMNHEPVGTALARHHRALQKLRKLLESPIASPSPTPRGTDA